MLGKQFCLQPSRRKRVRGARKKTNMFSGETRVHSWYFPATHWADLRTPTWESHGCRTGCTVSVGATGAANKTGVIVRADNPRPAARFCLNQRHASTVD